MLYEQYELKIQRIANVKGKILKFKVPIIAFLCMLLCALVTMLSIKGNITTDLQSVSSFTYGESISLQAEVLFGTPDFEFRQINTKSSDWTKEEPILPGKYEVRVTSNKIFGSTKGDAIQFDIFPIESTIKVREASIVFGNKFTYTANLLSGDTITYGDVDYEDYYTLEKQIVSPIVESIVVTNKDGKDVSTGYNFTSLESTVSLSKRTVTFTADSATKEYDKTELTCDTYQVSNIIEGHTYTLDTTGSITNYGTSINVVSNVNIFNDTENISYMYNIITNTGTLNITKKDLFITTSSATQTYDGTSLISEEFTHKGLISGDSVELISNVNRILFGEEDNKLVVTTNSENYNIIYTYGKLSITKRNINVETSSGTFIYDGLDHYSHSIVIDTLSRNDTYSIYTDTTIKLVGTITNNLVVKIYNGTLDISECYNITYKHGTLEVTKRDLHVTSKFATKEYDGTILEETSHYTSNLASTDITRILSNANILNVGEIDNEITVNVLNGNTDVSHCYNITYETNILVITSRIISVTTNDNSKEYDGTALSDSGWVYNTSKKLVENHNLVITTSGTITDYGSVDNTYISFEIYSNGQKVTNNYSVEILEGTLSISKRQVTVLTSSSSKVYDDTELTNSNFTVTESNFVLNHKLDLEVIGTITNVGIVSNFIGGYRVLNDVQDVSSNYDITFEFGTLEIELRVIDIITSDDIKMYDGEELTKEEWSYNNSKYELVDGHIDIVTFSGSIIDFGTVSNTIESFIIQRNGNDVTSNYTINIKNGTLEITKRFISVQTQSDEKVYDGVALTKEEWIYDESTYELVSGQILIINYTGSQLEVGQSKNTYDGFNVMNNLIDVTNNYDVTINLGILSVTALSINVTTNSNQYVYNGVVQYDNKYSVDLADNHTSSIDVITGELNVISNGINKYTIRIYDLLNNDVTSNYDISYTYGDLVITKRAVEITTDSSSKMYDATELTCKTWSYVDGEKFVSFHIFTIDITGSITEVLDANTQGEAENSYSNYFIIDENGNDVLSNYDLTINLGKLIIEHRPIIITTAGGSKEFDDTPLYVDGYIYNNDSLLLVDDHLLNITAFASVTYVTEGEVENQYNSDYSVTFNGINVTKNYKFDITLGVIFITPRIVNITTSSIEKVYDGEELFIHEWYYTNFGDNEIIFGHTFIEEYTKSLVNYGTIDNEMNYEIYKYLDGEKYDLRYDYDINITFGTISVLKRTISIKTNSATKIYDGEELFDAGWFYFESEYEFVDNVEIVITTSIRNFSTVNNIIDRVIINGIEDNENYYVIEHYGELSIEKRSVKIESKDLTSVYDGSEFSNIDIIVEETNSALNRGIASTDTWDITSFTTIKYVSVVENNITVLIYFDGLDYGDFNPNDNYNIEYVFGVLEVTQRTIKIKTHSTKEVYDGYYIENEGYDIIEGSLAIYDEITVISELNTKLYLVNTGIINNILTFKITHIDELDALNDNYKIEYEYGTLEMLKAEISIETASNSVVYDGNFLTGSYFVDEYGDLINLLGIDMFIIINYTKVKYYTESPVLNTIEFSISSGTMDVTDNYLINYTEGTLEITKREVVISTGSNTFVYNGDDHYYESYKIESELSFVSVDMVQILFPAYVTYVSDGFVENIVEIVYGIEAARDSYSVICEAGFIDVIQADIVLTTASDAKFFDGDPLTNTNYEITGLDGNHTEFIDVIGTITDPGVTKNIINQETFAIFYNGKDVTDNFKIGYELGDLIVYELDLIIYSTGGEFEYDGYDLTHGEIYIIRDGAILFHGQDSMSFEFALTKTDIIYIEMTGRIDASDINSPTPNTFTYKILRGDEDITDGVYSFAKEERLFEIVPRKITVTSESGDFEYNGEKNYLNSANITEGSLVLDHTISYTYTGYIDNIGLKENFFEAFIKSGSVAVDSFYDVTYIYGNLLMSPGVIVVTTPSNSDSPFIFNGKEQWLTDGFKIDSESDIDLESLFDIIVDDETITTIRNVSSSGILNDFKIIIYSGDIDVTSSFEIEYILGTLEMIALDIEVSALDNSVSYEYNGFDQTIIIDDVKINKNIFDEFIVVNATTALAPVDKINLVFEIYFNEFNENYNITYNIDTATLTITTRKITIESVDNFIEFTGEGISSYDYTITSGSFALDHEYNMSFITSTVITNINYVDYEFLNDKDLYRIIFTGVEIQGIEDVSKYYDITFNNYGYLAVTQIAMSASTESFTKPYDGETLSLNSVNLVGKSLDGHEFIFTIDNAITNVGKINNDFQTLVMVDKNGIYSYDELLFIYNFTFYIGVLEVTQRDIEIITFTYNRPYAQEKDYTIIHNDFKGYIIPNNVNPLNSLVANQTIEITATESSIGGYGVIALTDFVIKDSNGADVTRNYNIITDSREIIYTQINVTITAASATKEYDGNVLYDWSATVTEGYLISGHRFEVVMDSSRTTVGSSFNKIVSYSIIDDDGIELTEEEIAVYYNISTVDGILTIT